MKALYEHILEGLFDKRNREDVGKNIDTVSNWGSVYKLYQVGGYTDKTASMLDIKNLKKLTDGMKPVNPEVEVGLFSSSKRDNERMRMFVTYLENLSFADFDFPDLDTKDGRREFTKKLNERMEKDGVLNAKRSFAIIPAIGGSSQIQIQFLENNPRLYNSAIILRFNKK